MSQDDETSQLYGEFYLIDGKSDVDVRIGAGQIALAFARNASPKLLPLDVPFTIDALAAREAPHWLLPIVIGVFEPDAADKCLRFSVEATKTLIDTVVTLKSTAGSA